MKSSWSIRPACVSDAEAITEIYATLVLESHASFETVAPGVRQMQERIEAVLDSHVWLVCADSSNVARAYAYASSHRAREAYRWT